MRCVFPDWEKLPEREQKAYERLSIRFSDGYWPRFVHKRRGYVVAPLTPSEFESVEECLWHFREQLDAMHENGDLFDFEPGNIAWRCYDTEIQEWRTVITASEMPQDPGRPLLIYADTPGLQSLKQIPVSMDAAELEADYGWTLSKEPPTDGYKFDMHVVVVDRKTKKVLVEYRCHQEDSEACMFAAVLDAIVKYGKPRVIYTSRNESADVLGDLACKLDFQLKQIDFLPGATNYLYWYGAV